MPHHAEYPYENESQAPGVEVEGETPEQEYCEEGSYEESVGDDE